MNSLKITVVTVCYNAAGSIEDTILSVLNQTYPNIEYIVIDGGSTDGTVDIIQKYADRLDYWISEPDKGIYDAMNKGIAVATGDYINFMNAGDRFENDNVIKTIVEKIDQSAVIVSGKTHYREHKRDFILSPLPLTSFPRKIPYCHQSCFVNTAYHQKHPFDTSFKYCADYNFFFNTYVREGGKIQYIDTVIAEYDASTGASKDNLYETGKEAFRIWGIENDFFRRLPWEAKLRLYEIRSKFKIIMPKAFWRIFDKVRFK